jgi:ABC-type uncharacterized transport system permease subunit
MLGIAIAALYITSAAVLLRLTLNGKVTQKKALTLAPAAIGSVLHALLVLQSLVIKDGLDLNFINTLNLIAWLTTTFFLILSSRRPIESLGIAVLPISAITVLTISLFGSDTETMVKLNLQSHIFFSVTAYALLGLGALQAMLLSLQSQQLRNHKPNGFIKALPPLNQMESMLFMMLSAGFILLSLSLLSGFVFLDNMFAQRIVHKTILSMAAWALFGTLLYGRWRYGWRGKLAIRWTLWAFLLLILAYFGTKFILEYLVTTT